MRPREAATRSRHASNGTAVLEIVETGTCTGDARLPNSPAGYDLLRYLGGGGMGDVYLAREHTAERVVAMKFLRGAAHSTAAERSVTEVRALAKLDHPNIVRVISVDGMQDRDNPFFTMEYASGGTLNDRIKKTGPFAPMEAARIVAQVARAVEVAHGANILHRDIKPSNIVLADGDLPKITDFGLAKRTDLDEGLSMSTGPLGTPAYMPPEQISSKHGSLGPASDVYGLGATLYHLLTGRPPFQGDTQQDICTKVVKNQPERVHSLRPDVPPELEGIVVKCMEKSSGQRYASASDLADDLDRFLAGQAPVAPRQTRLRRSKRWAGRNRWNFAAGVLGLTLALTLFFAGRDFARDPQVPATPQDPLAEIQKELAAGRKVELIGKTGLPRWSKFHYLQSTLGPSNLPDNACSFQSPDLTMLELLPDPGIQKYRIRVELQNLAVTHPPPPGAQIGLERIGVFFGADPVRTIDGRDLITFFALRFNDSTPVPVAGPPPVIPQVRFQPAFVVQVGPGGNLGPGDFKHLGDSVNFTPARVRPGPWRTVEIDVSVDGIAVRWIASPTADPTTISQWTGDETRNRYLAMQPWLTKTVPGQIIRPWAPGRGLGIWCYQSAVAFRNVTIEPLP